MDISGSDSYRTFDQGRGDPLNLFSLTRGAVITTATAGKLKVANDEGPAVGASDEEPRVELVYDRHVSPLQVLLPRGYVA